MAKKAYSFKNEPWSSLPKQSYSVINDDFVHEKLLVVKANAATEKAGVNLKETLVSKQGAFTTSGQMKLWFLINKKTLYTKITNNSLKLHMDFGTRQRGENKFNRYVSFSSARDLSNGVLKAGMNVIGNSWEYSNRLRVDMRSHCTTYYKKYSLKRNNWTFSGLGAFDICNVILKKQALCLGHHRANGSCYFRAENDGWRTQKNNMFNVWNWFDTYSINYIQNLSDSETLGLETSINSKGSLKQFCGVFQKTYDNKKQLKLKASSKKTLACSIRQPLNGYGTYLVGTQISDLGGKNNVKYGVQFDLSL